MTDIVVKIRKKRSDLPIPVYKTAGSVGCDVTAAEDVVIKAGSSALVPTGLFLEVPVGYECQVRPRSGLALSHGVTVLNSPGTIDSDYRGEVQILLHNTSRLPVRVETGDRIAQLVFAPVTRATFQVTEELTDTARGAGGWGSTGVR
jgi:dUTP pyrophosphatase